MDYQIEELFPIVSWLAEKYGGYESTSVTYERAQTLMGAVIYCLEEFNNAHANSLADNSLSIKEQYDIGVKLVYEKAAEIRKIFNGLSVCFEDYGVKCLYDTVKKGIPGFLKWYDVRYDPQNTIMTLDYPLLFDCGFLRGADAVYEYISGIQAEQRFLEKFDKEYIISVLKRTDPQYKYMTENICEIILTNMTGHAMLEKPLNEMGFQKDEYLRLEKIFEKKPVSRIEEIIRNTVKEMVRRLSEDDRESVFEYLCCGAGNIAVRIEAAVKFDRLDRLFLA